MLSGWVGVSYDEGFEGGVCLFVVKWCLIKRWGMVKESLTNKRVEYYNMSSNNLWTRPNGIKKGFGLLKGSKRYNL